MRNIPRLLQVEISKAAKHFPAILLTGPRRSGKTTILRKMFPRAQYFLLEDPDIIDRVRTDPRRFLEQLKPPVILDEIQNVPELFNYVRTMIDKDVKRKGQWLLTGSQEAPLMRRVTESMAGRVAIVELWPLSRRETDRVSPLVGGFPEVLAAAKNKQMWFRSYLQTYLERDVRGISDIRDLSAFRRFLSVLASRSGQVLNKTDMAAPLGVSVPTITQWLSVLEITAQIIIVPPFFENFGKRLIKSPKVYFTDSGMACHLLGIETQAALDKSPFLGAIYEGFVLSELIKNQINQGRRKEVYYFRDEQGLEIDFIVPLGNAQLALLEVKASRTPRPEMAVKLAQLAKKIDKYSTIGRVVYWPKAKTKEGLRAIYPDVEAIGCDELLHQINAFAQN